MSSAPYGAEGKPSSQNRTVFRLNQSRAAPDRAPEGWVPPLSPVDADRRLCFGPGEPRGGLLGGQGRRHASRGSCAAVSFQMKKKRLFSLEAQQRLPQRQKEAASTHGPCACRDTAGATRLQRTDPLRLPLIPTHRHSAGKRCGGDRPPLPGPMDCYVLVTSEKKPPQSRRPRPQGAGWLRAQRSALISPRLRSPGAGARALTSPSTINLPSTALLPHLAFNVKTYIFVGSGLSRALVI